MWVVIAKRGLDIHRDEMISELLGEEKTPQEFSYCNVIANGIVITVHHGISILKDLMSVADC